MGDTVIPVCFTVRAAHGHVDMRTDLGFNSTDPGADTPSLPKQTKRALVTVRIILAPVHKRFSFKDDRSAFLDSNNVVRIRNNVQRAALSDHPCKNTEAWLRSDSSSRSVARLTARAALCLFSPYCPPLALNRIELSEGSSCLHSDPIRYIVREASHQVHSAHPARSRRGLVGIHQVLEVLLTFNNI